MYTKEGFWDIVPAIKSVSFPARGKFQVDLKDGRKSEDNKFPHKAL